MAIKMMLDAQMIDQLMQRQEVEDKKRLLMLGADGLNPIKPKPGEQRRAKSTLKPRTVTEPDSKEGIPKIELPGKNQTADANVQIATTRKDKSLYEEIVRPFERNAAKDPQVLKIDQRCPAGGATANSNLRLIKKACLVYT